MNKIYSATKLCLKLLSLTLFFACNTNSSNEKKDSVVKEVVISADTKKMINRISEIYDQINPINYPSMNTRRAEIFRKALDTARSKEVGVNLYFLYCDELLSSGKSKEAINELQNLLKQSGIAEDDLNAGTKPIFEKLAIAYLRTGEQDNCISNHSGESCIVPIQGKGVHQYKNGSTKAIEIYKKILAKFPTDYNSIWLMNVAYMTLGEYPKSVPAKFLLPTNKLLPDGKFPKFKNISVELGIDINGHAGGTCIEDFNNDGYLDIMNSSWGLKEQIHLLINNGDGSFTDKTEEAGLTGMTGGLNMIHADYNNDGFVDVLVLRGAWNSGIGGRVPNSLLKNNGDGTFSEAAYEAGIYSEHPTQNACWADVNLDGWLDLFIGNESAPPEFIEPCEFYLNNGNGTFTNVAKQLGLDMVGFVKGSTWGDINNDGFPDLYVSMLKENNKLFLNNGGATVADLKFTDVTTTAAVQKPFNSFPCWFFDYDNDGWQDLFASGYDLMRFNNVAEDEARAILGLPIVADKICLYHNNGNGTFTNVSKQVGIDRAMYTMGCNFDDINNDGWADFYLGTGTPQYTSITPNRMYLNNAGKNFTDVTVDGGFGIIQKGHGVAFGDMDNDGDQDLYEDIGGANEGDNFHNAFFDNPGFNNNWIVLQLNGKTANRSAIGARIKIIITENGIQRNIYKTVGTGGSFGSSSLQVEIGIGIATVIDKIEITWPDKQLTVQLFTTVAAGKKYVLEQGGQLQAVTYNKFAWKLKTPVHDMSTMKM